MLTAALIGIGSVATGLLVSFHADTSASATVAVIPIVAFFVVLTVRSAAGGRRDAAEDRRSIPARGG
jgi:manganese/iron transport system permease protein